MSDERGEYGFAPLTEKNYSTWVLDARALFMRKGLLGYVTGTSRQPSESDSDALAVWHDKSEQAAGYLYASLDASRKEIVAEEFSQCNPPAMWAKLQSVHQQKKPSSRFIAYEVLLSSVLQDGESLPTFGARVSGAYWRVKELVPSTYTVEQMGEELTVMAIVRGMPFEQYGSFRSQLMMKDALSLSTLKELLQQEQANRGQGSAQQSALAAASSGAKLRCYFCDLDGHLQKDCKRYIEAQKTAKDSAAKAKTMRRGKKTSTKANSAEAAPQKAAPSDSAAASASAAEFAGNASDPCSPSFNSSVSDWNADHFSHDPRQALVPHIYTVAYSH